MKKITLVRSACRACGKPLGTVHRERLKSSGVRESKQFIYLDLHNKCTIANTPKGKKP